MRKWSLYFMFVGLLFLASLSAVLAQTAASQQDKMTTEPTETTSDTPTVAPVIIISHPSVKEVFKVDTITVYGTIKPVEKIERLVITVNGEEVSYVEGIESWKATVTLTRGANDIVVMAVDVDGNAASKAAVTVYYVPPEVVASLAEKEIPEILKREIIKKRVIAAKLADISRPERDRYLIDRESAQLKKAALEIKFRSVREDVAAEDIVIEEYTEVASDMTSDEKSGVGLSTDEELLSTFVRVESNLTDIDWAIIKIEFTDEEIRLKRLAREKLFMVWYDDNEGSPTFGRWVRLRKGHPAWIHAVGINKTGRYVWANVSHFSVYGIGGQIATPTPTPPPETTPPTETPPPTQTQAPPAETQPPTHFPEETPRPTVTAQPTSAPAQIMESPVPRAPASARMAGRGLLLFLLLIILFLALLFATGRKKEQPTEETPAEDAEAEDAEKDLLAEEETPSDDYPVN